MSSPPVAAPERSRPSGLAKALGWLGLVLMIVPVGFPMYAAIGLVGFGVIWVVFTATWVVLLVLGIVSIRRRPLLSFATPFIASALYFALFEIVELFDPPA